MAGKSDAKAMYDYARWKSSKRKALVYVSIEGKLQPIPIENIKEFREDGFFIWDVDDKTRRLVPVSTIIYIDLTQD